jgi:hypothetical protein
MRRLTIGSLLTSAIALGLLLAPTVSFAQNIFDDTRSTATGTNVSTLRIPGTVLSGGPSAGNWTLNVFAQPGDCVRLDVASQGGDLLMVVRAPDGTVFRNDDRPGDLRPLVKINSAPNNGWYSVSLARFAGVAADNNFVLLYGRYNGGNPNCSSPTPPLSPTRAVSKPQARFPAPQRSEPGFPE